jgi:peptidoglycan/LPS O-acetylase OafA/YrhL
MICYLFVAVLGVVGLASRRWISPIIFSLALVGALLLPPLTFPGLWTIPQVLVRSAIMFAAGSVMYQWRDVIPARWSLVAISVVIVVLASIYLPDYRVVAALPLAYAVIVPGALIHNKRLRLRTDVSYGLYIYAFPMQQLLAVIGLAFLNSIVFAVVSGIVTLPIAALSWFLVEKRALSLKSRLKRKRKASAEGPQPEDPGESEARDIRRANRSQETSDPWSSGALDS